MALFGLILIQASLLEEEAEEEFETDAAIESTRVCPVCGKLRLAMDDRTLRCWGSLFHPHRPTSMGALKQT
jgi:hypothetical protein